jgi:hypothetical protein
MRPNWTGWAIITFFAIGGIGFWIAMPEIWIGQIWVAVAGFGGLLYVFMNRRADVADVLIATGIRGTAHIREATQTGMYFNNHPRVTLKLHIEAPGVAPFEDETTQTVPLIALGQLSTGKPLTVFLNPADPSDYVIDWSGVEEADD